MSSERRSGSTPEEPATEPRDLVSTREGVRPQRSTEEHGSGLDRGAPEPVDRVAGGQGDVGPPSSGPGTPEGHTPEKPTTDEYGKVGTPAAGLSSAEPHADADEHAEAALGPIDWRAWGASALGLGVAAVIAALFYLATLPR